MKCAWHGVENCPVSRTEDAVREFSHQHDEGVCRPSCYGCFIIREAKADVDAVVLALRSGTKRGDCNIVVAGEYDLHCTVHDRTALECSRVENAELREALQGLLEDLKGSPQGVCIVAAARARKALGIAEKRVEGSPKKDFVCAKCQKPMQFQDGMCMACFGGDPGD